MARKRLLWGMLTVVLVLGMTIVGCTQITMGPCTSTDVNTGTTTDANTGTDTGVVFDLALRAVPIDSSDDETGPEVLYSDSVYLDKYGIVNRYLIDVGYIDNTFVSTLFHVHYNGMSPMTVKRTTIDESTVINSLTTSISQSIAVSTTQSHKAGLEAAWKKKFPLVGEFSVKLNYEYAFSETTASSTTRGTQTSVEDIRKKSESLSTEVTIGEHGEPAGNYRYAIYSTCDVYFIIYTSPDNQELKGWDTVVCARSSNEYFPHWDYSPDGIFDNSPIGNEITFSEDFYKKLPKPDTYESSPPPAVAHTLPTITTDFVSIRKEAKKITSSGKFNQHFDQVSFDSYFGIDLSKLKQDGYKTINFYIRLDVSEYDNTYEYLYLFTSPAKSDDYIVSTLSFQHTDGKKDTSWWTHYEDELKFENKPLDKFTNYFVIRYGSTSGIFHDWANRNLFIKLVITS